MPELLPFYKRSVRIAGGPQRRDFCGVLEGRGVMGGSKSGSGVADRQVAAENLWTKVTDEIRKMSIG